MLERVLCAAPRAALLVACALTAPTALAACLSLSSFPDGLVLSRVPLPPDSPTFALTYVHSVTRTPVAEEYSAIGGELVETEIRFEQHGPGMPTEADSGGTFSRSDGKFVVTMDRHFPMIVMRVHADQSPRLVVGMRAMDLAQWGNRALSLGAVPDPCTGS